MQILPLRRRFTDERPLASSDDLERADQALNLRLKKSYGRWLLFLLGLQLLAANGLMFAYAGWGYDWRVPDAVMRVWLAATVVQLIGVVYVVVTHLFPRANLR